MKVKVNTVWRSGMFAFGLLGLSGCAQLPIDWQMLSNEVAVQVEPDLVRQKILISPEIYGVKSRIEKQKVIIQEVAQQTAVVEPLVYQLRNMSQEGIREMLGVPSRQLHQGNMRVWQYLVQHCQWDMYFWLDEAQRLTLLKDLIVHQAGRVITDSAEIAECEQSFRSKIAPKLG